jgi:hypothetical protein
MRGINRGVLAAAVLVCASAGVNAQTVGNASFEDPLFYDVPPAAGGWTGFFGGPPTAVLSAAQNTTAPRTGLNALYLKVAAEGASFAGMQQPVAGVVPGASYDMKIWARAAGNVNNGVEYRIEWRDAVGAPIGDQFALTTPIQSLLTNQYQQFVLTAVAPPNAVSANLVIAVQSFTFNPLTPVFDTEVYIDDVEFVSDAPTPCPADFNGVGGVTVQDIFDFLSAWSAGCP